MPKFYADVDIKASSLKIESATALEPTIEILSTANSVYGGILKFNKQQIDNTPSDSDSIGWISFAGEDVLGAENFYGSIICTAAEVDAGNEAGKIQISVANDGVSRNGITMTGDKNTAEEVDVTIANGTDSVTTIAGDLSITTGLLLDSVDITTIQTSSESFADNNTSLMTSAAIDDRITAAGGGATFASDQEVADGTEAAEAVSPDTLRDAAWSRTMSGVGFGSSNYKFQGDIAYFGSTSSMEEGRIYHFKNDGTWELADPNSVDTSDGLLGIALGASSNTNGMLLRGMYVVDYYPGDLGDVLYLDEQQVSSLYGAATDTAPAGNNDIVRIIGYVVDAGNPTHGIGSKIWFNPDNTFVEVVT